MKKELFPRKSYYHGSVEQDYFLPSDQTNFIKIKYGNLIDMVSLVL